MSLKRKIIAWTVFTILAIPALGIFNNNGESFIYNVLGLVYACCIVKLAPLFLPAWMIKYYRDCKE
jgi:hypothetical protein